MPTPAEFPDEFKPLKHPTIVIIKPKKMDFTIPMEKSCITKKLFKEAIYMPEVMFNFNVTIK